MQNKVSNGNASTKLLYGLLLAVMLPKFMFLISLLRSLSHSESEAIETKWSERLRKPTKGNELLTFFCIATFFLEKKWQSWSVKN